MLIIGITITAISFLLVLGRHFIRKSAAAAVFGIIRAAIGSLGILGVAAVALIFNYYTASCGITEEKLSWAHDSFYLYFGYSTGAAAFFVILFAAAAILKSRAMWLREWGALVAMLFMLTGALAYGAFARDSVLPIYEFIILLGSAQAAALMLPGAIDSLQLRREWREEEKIEKLRRAKAKKKRRHK